MIPWKRRLLGLRLCALLIPTALFVARYNSRTPNKHDVHTRIDSTNAAGRFEPLSFPPASFFIGVDPAVPEKVWRFNSRALSLVSSLCVQSPTDNIPDPPLYLASAPNASRCIVTHADYSTAAEVTSHHDCAELHKDNVLCAHGRIEHGDPPFCPEVRPLREFPAHDASKVLWLYPDEVAFIVPDLLFSGNIFHFTFELEHILEAMANLPGLLRSSTNANVFRDLRRVALVFRGLQPESLGRWQTDMLTAQLRGLKKQERHLRSTEFRIISLSDEDYADKQAAGATSLCARQAVLLGTRGHQYLWPFANDSAVSHDGTRVPRAAVAFRRRAFDAFGIASTLPVAAVKRATFEAPPLVVAYARRLSFPDLAGHVMVRSGWRRLSDADDAWLVQTLRAEAERANATLRELPDGRNVSVEEQVRAMSGAGLVVGLHGANLVNAMFAPPFAALLEITPHNAVLTCYEAGMNTGLRYWVHEGAPVSAEESHCRKGNFCYDLPQQRRVDIGSETQRAQLRTRITDALAYLNALRHQFPRGIPARYKAEEAVYSIDEGGRSR